MNSLQNLGGMFEKSSQDLGSIPFGTVYFPATCQDLSSSRKRSKLENPELAHIVLSMPWGDSASDPDT